MRVDDLPEIGAPLEGGFHGGVVRIGVACCALVWASKTAGQAELPLTNKRELPLVATSCCDSLANTRALADAGSPAAQWAMSLRFGGHEDWCLPARDVLEMGYRYFKPGSRRNFCTFRDGDNPSSEPPGYPYTETVPGQVECNLFRAGEAEAFDECWYWSSTQAGPRAAWNQNFKNGNQNDNNDLSAEGAVRAVRRFIALQLRGAAAGVLGLSREQAQHAQRAGIRGPAGARAVRFARRVVQRSVPARPGRLFCGDAAATA